MDTEQKNDVGLGNKLSLTAAVNVTLKKERKHTHKKTTFITTKKKKKDFWTIR